MNSNNQSTTPTTSSPDESKKQLKKHAKREARVIEAIEQTRRELKKAEQKLARAQQHVQQQLEQLQAEEAKLEKLRVAFASQQGETPSESTLSDLEDEANALLETILAEVEVSEVPGEEQDQEEEGLVIFDENETIELVISNREETITNGDSIDVSFTRELISNDSFPTIEETALTEEQTKQSATDSTDEELAEIATAAVLEQELAEVVIALREEEELEQLASDLVEQELSEADTAAEIEEQRTKAAVKTLAEEELEQLASDLVDQQLTEAATANEIKAKQEAGQDKQLAEETSTATPQNPARTARKRPTTSGSPRPTTRKRTPASNARANGTDQSNKIENE